jgi:multimeric flavodoxin WrbA
MNILVLNGSPRGEQSNTLKVARAFLEGISSHKKVNADIIDISKAEISHCRGCFACWRKTPGECVIKDDMQDLIPKYLDADLVIWSFPLYYFGMPSKPKAFLDRLLPTILPSIELSESGSCRHPSRYEMSGKRFVLISTCGFCSVENNYEALLKQFEIIYGKNLTKIICTEGELFRVPQREKRTGEYLSYVRQAGKEYAMSNCITSDTQRKLSEPLYPPEVFVQMANASWGISDSHEIDERNG